MINIDSYVCLPSSLTCIWGGPSKWPHLGRRGSVRQRCLFWDHNVVLWTEDSLAWERGRREREERGRKGGREEKRGGIQEWGGGRTRNRKETEVYLDTKNVMSSSTSAHLGKTVIHSGNVEVSFNASYSCCRLMGEGAIVNFFPSVTQSTTFITFSYTRQTHWLAPHL